MANPSAFGGGEELERFKAILANWRTSLVDLSGRNRLLNFRHTKAATLEIAHPSAEELVEGLERGWEFAPLPDEEPDADGSDGAVAEKGPAERRDARQGIVTQKTTGPALLRALTSLRSKSTQLFNDYGLWTLQLGVGMLRWREDGASTSSDAPLILLPVRIERLANGRIRLVLNDDEEPRLNPALRVKLEQFHIDWSPVTEQDPTDLDAVIHAVATAVEGKSGWEVSRRVVLALFASHKESMYQDLLENEARILGSDLVRAVALGPKAGLASDRFDFEEIDADRIDELSPPEDSPLVLDADASQRQAVAAAVAGQSFVLDGPPGTGKSQTITNMIAGLMHAGRSVLFVSEKAAALDVVLDRLKSVGLDSYALPLHSHNTSRRAVAQELGRALEEEPRAPRLSQEAVARAREAREALSAYAEAMNEISQPLGQSLHDVIGRVGRLSEAPVAFLASEADGGTRKQKVFDAAALSAQDLHLVIEATKAIADAWQAVADPSFPWRDLKAGSPHPRPALDQAMAARDGLAAAVARYQDLSADGEPIEDEDGVRRLIKILELVESRRPVPEAWLTSADFADKVESPVDDFVSDLKKVVRAQATARSVAGARWEELSPRLTPVPSEAEHALGTLSPAGMDPSGLTEEGADELAREFETTADRLERTHRGLAELAQQLGLNIPGSAAAADDLCDVVALAGAEHRPLEQWLVPGGAAEADRAAVSVVADGLRAFTARRDTVLSAQARATAEAGPGWAAIPAALDAEAPASEQDLAGLEPAGLALGSLTRTQAAELSDGFASLGAALESADQHAVSMARLLGRDRPRSTQEAEELIALVELATASHRMLEAWFDPQVMPRVREACAEISDAARRLTDAEQAAQSVFRPETAVTPELPDLIRRLSEGSRGIGGLLSGAVRADRKALGALTIAGSWRSELYDQLPLALAWHTAHDRLRSLARTHAAHLGRYAGTDLPDVPAMEAALAHADSVHRLAPDTVLDPHRRGLLALQVADGRAPARELLEHSRALSDDLGTWRQDLTRPHLAAAADELTKRSLVDAARWLRDHLDPLARAVDVIDTVASIGRREDGPDFAYTLAGARTAISAAQESRRETEGFAADADTHRRLLGSWYKGLDTDPAELCAPASGTAQGEGEIAELLHRAWSVRESTPGACSDDEQRKLLGRYAPDGRADTVALQDALEAAHTVERLAPDTLGDPARRARLVGFLADGRPVPQSVLRQAEPQIRTDLFAWREYAGQPHLAAAGAHLLAGPLQDAARWLRAHIEPFEDAADLLHAVARVADAPSGLSLSRAREAVTAVLDARAAESRFTEEAPAHRELIGDLYQGAATDKGAVLDALDWAQKVRRTAHGGHGARLSVPAARLLLDASADTSVADRHDDWQRQRDNLVAHFDVQRGRLLQRELRESLPAAAICLSQLDEDPFGPEAWTTCAESLKLLRRYGLDGLPSQLAQREVSAADFPAAVERAVLTAWIERRLELDARLKPMRAVDRDQLVERFRDADRGLVEAAHAEVIAACNARRPRRTNIGPAAELRRQAQLKRRHKPVRQLLGETRDVVRLIKPCFMMSPLTVSQFLPSDFRFDVVIFDEASQVLPQDAVNSIYRGSALIVAGDQKQLPPTSFFSAGGDGDDDDEWDEEGADNFESVLDACKATGVLRGLPLRWHYRSRHENLIAFSNHEFYDDTMVTFPGAFEQSPDLGVEFYKADGVYDRGGRSNNPGEAAVVAQRVIHHFATRPGLSLGVVALSKAQAEAIEEAVQKARTARPDLDRFFTEDRLDGFFVKNLETVQGDERDVIILSVGYGPDQRGKLLSTFGPINRDGGWRRLNVAVTRARRRMEVVASFHGSELSDSGNKSVQHLKRYLQYAEHGPHILQTAAADPDAVPESPFEEEVLDVLRGWGYSVQPQVGVAGFRIDMAVRHPAAPGSYALGIECDGVMYHSSRAARDRDRLRESVLRDLGWKLHRIWGTDWYRNRRDAMARLRAAVEEACARDPFEVTAEEPAGDRAVAEVPARAETLTDTTPTVTFVAVDDGPPAWSRAYEEVVDAQLVNLRLTSAKRRGMRYAELQDPDAVGVVADVALSVIKAEGPMTEDLIFTRVRSAWGIARAGAVVRDSVRRALRKIASAGQIVRVGEAYDVPDRERMFARTPTLTVARKVGQVPSVERRLVVRHVVEESPGVHRDELMREVARFFGWTRRGPDIRDALTADVDELVAQGAVRETDGFLMPTDGD
ncbi:DUF3320 domain-containing protein [Streptomyces solicathayae]|uniref:DUF3320 domain-containing protein n=1 Tax=Streptomyces solicathayae TaxID=3081768 RepID=A0ABZ0LPT2_9ACTN|nr:DUF3320 domain-containing protein [Streptomyces sp. HUAS YS2]WOX21231.1 DUF3320 domain-containing protein [Streptomyces sp. HUAS YS2]